MNHYNVQDFLRYYGNSFMLHPHTGETFRVYAQDPNNPNCIITDKKDSVRLEDLDWKHVQTPDALGYRGLLDGKALYYITRKAGRRTRKGVTPEAIMIGIPTTVRALAQEIGAMADIEKHAILQDWIAKAIFKPEFMSMAAAVDALCTKKHTLGFALSPNWAITLGLYKDEPLLLHFKNIRVAGGKDGRTWKFYDKDAESLFSQYLKDCA